MRTPDTEYCTECQRKVRHFEFRDVDALAEYYISGMCQHCQDKLFRAGDKPMPGDNEIFN